MQRNLDPLVFQDCDFSSDNHRFSATEKGMSFAELPVRHVAERPRVVTQHPTTTTASPVKRKNTHEDKLTKGKNSGNGGFVRNLMKANINAKN